MIFLILRGMLLFCVLFIVLGVVGSGAVYLAWIMAREDKGW
jgi:hypothetical protein